LLGVTRSLVIIGVAVLLLAALAVAMMLLPMVIEGMPRHGNGA
jgi:hypothetical protein